jgi:hypothetical protein
MKRLSPSVATPWRPIRSFEAAASKEPPTPLCAGIRDAANSSEWLDRDAR